jgi:ureidoglycolate hydrolase
MDHTIAVRDLDNESFARYGQVLSMPPGPAGRSGEGWRCWYGFFEIDCPRPLVFGAVVTEAREVVVREMERHVTTFELIYPHDHDLIQVVGPPADLLNEEANPVANEAEAFRIPVGSAVLLREGTWHSPAFPMVHATTYGFACLQYPGTYLPEWRRFSRDGCVRAVPGN